MARKRTELKGKAVLITGAARGIGAETARKVAARGARVALVGLEPEMLERVAADCGPDTIWREADITDADALEAAIEESVGGLGGLDIAMVNAGIASGAAFRASDPRALEKVIEVNLLGSLRTIVACLPHLIERRGYLLQVASVSALAPSPGLAAYSASKAGVEALANTVRVEVKHLGVDVGVAYYSWIDTDLVRGGDDHPDFSRLRQGLKGPLAKTYPVGKAADATVHGFERRARWVTCPGWLKPMILARGIAPFVAEPQLHALMPELDQLSQEKVERLGRERASTPAGAGGEAAVRSAPLS